MVPVVRHAEASKEATEKRAQEMVIEAEATEAAAVAVVLYTSSYKEQVTRDPDPEGPGDERGGPLVHRQGARPHSGAE